MREIRSSGSVRGVRSNPYPYRDQPVGSLDQLAHLFLGKPFSIGDTEQDVEQDRAQGQHFGDDGFFGRAGCGGIQLGKHELARPLAQGLPPRCGQLLQRFVFLFADPRPHGLNPEIGHVRTAKTSSRYRRFASC